MVNELAQELDPIEKEEGQAVEEPQETTQEAEKVEAEGETQEGEQKPPEKPPKGYVPQGALHEERERRKQLQREISQIQAEQQQTRAALEHRLQQIQQAAWQAQQPKPPSFEDDPIAAMKHGVEMTQQEIAQIRDHQRREYEAQQQAYQQQQWKSQLEGVVSQDIAEFVQEQPDYIDAINDLRTRRHKQHMALGASPQQAAQMVYAEEYQLAAQALQAGKSPARAAYEIALGYGYTKKEAKQASENVQKMETLQKGVKAASSLGSGGTPTGKLTVDAIAQMNDEEFDGFMKSGGWNKLG